MANALLAQLGDPGSATNIGSLVPFYVMVFMAKAFVAATPLIVRGLSGNFMVVAEPNVFGGAVAVARGGGHYIRRATRARVGTLSTGEIVGRSLAQAPSVTLATARKGGETISQMADWARRIGRI